MPVDSIDLEKVARLIDALEHDLAGMPAGSDDVQRLKDEVAALKGALAAAPVEHASVHSGLHGINNALDEALDTAVADGIKVGQYISEIGRILGL